MKEGLYKVYLEETCYVAYVRLSMVGNYPSKREKLFAFFLDEIRFPIPVDDLLSYGCTLKPI